MKALNKILFISLLLVMAAACSPAVRFAEKTLTTGIKTGSNEPVKAAAGDTWRGFASFYADKFHGRMTSSGEVFDMNGFTAAHRTLPFGTKVKVTNLKNRKSVIVKINDRGPFNEDRILDLSRAAAESIDMLNDGVAEVEITVIE